MYIVKFSNVRCFFPVVPISEVSGDGSMVFVSCLFQQILNISWLTFISSCGTHLWMGCCTHNYFEIYFLPRVVK